MKKRLLTLCLIGSMLLSGMNTGALVLETVERADEEAPAYAETATELAAITESDRLQYTPADKYGNLIGSISFDNQNASRDEVSFAPAMESVAVGANCTFNYVADPTGTRAGYVLDMNNTDALHRIAVKLFNSDATRGLQVGKYTVTFDAYTPTGTPKDSFFRFDLGAASVYFNSEVYANCGKWATYSFDFEVTAVNADGTVSALVNGSAASFSQKPVFNAWFQKAAGNHVYFDNFRLYEFPENNAAWIDHLGNRTICDVSDMTTIPLPSEIISASNDDESFYAWKDDEGNLYKAGAAVEPTTLKYKTLTGSAKSYVYFENGTQDGQLDEFTTIPYPSQVDASWSDEGFYAWEDQDGVYYLPGTKASAIDLADYEMTVVKTADYNATLNGTKIDENGVLLYSFSFDTESAAFQPWTEGCTADYRDADYTASTPYVFRVTANSSWQVVADETGAERGNVLKGTTSGVDRLGVQANVTAGPGTYVVKADIHSTSPYLRIDFSDGSMNRVDGAAGAWRSVSTSVKTSSAVQLQSLYVALTNAAYTHYIDDLCYYWVPNNSVFFDNADGAQAVYYGGANGKVVIPTPSAVNANWSDDGFGGWTDASGKLYRVGDTVEVSALAGKVLKNEVPTVAFTFGAATEKVTDISTIPYPSGVNASWSDNGFYGWKLGDTYYRPGDNGSDVLFDQTLVGVTTADYNASLSAMKANENGLLLLSADFSAGTSAYSYVNGNYMTGDTIGGTNATVTDDPFDSGRGKVLHVSSTSGGHLAMFKFSGTVGTGTVTYRFDSYETGATYLTKQNNFSTGDTTPYPTSIKDKWYSHNRSFEVSDASKSLTYYNIWGGGGSSTGDLYVDNLSISYKPSHSVIFINNGDGAAYFGNADGSFVLPAPSAVHADWSNEGFYAWKSSDGKLFKAGTAAKVSDFDGKTLTAVTEAQNNAPLSLNKFSIRTSGLCGMRAASFVNNDARENATEYGYIVSRKSFFDSVDHDYDTYLVFPAGYDTSVGSGMLASVNGVFVNGISYDPASGTDLVYTTDGSVFGDDVNYESLYSNGGVYFTCVLVGMSNYRAYHETMVIRPYLKCNGMYFYGQTTEACLYDLAVQYQSEHGTGNAFVDGIVSAALN